MNECRTVSLGHWFRAFSTLLKNGRCANCSQQLTQLYCLSHFHVLKDAPISDAWRMYNYAYVHVQNLRVLCFFRVSGLQGLQGLNNPKQINKGCGLPCGSYPPTMVLQPPHVSKPDRIQLEFPAHHEMPHGHLRVLYSFCGTWGAQKSLRYFRN